MIGDFYNTITSFFYIIYYKFLSKFCKIIFVLSDSHSAINPYIYRRIKYSRPSVIIHCGDWSTLDVYYELKECCENIIGIAGNTESVETSDFFNDSADIEINGFKIHIIHELENRQKYIYNIPEEKKYNIILSGHTHKPLKKRAYNILFFNPGSCGPKRFSNVSPSYGIFFFIGNFFFCRCYKIPFQIRQGYY